MYKIALGLPTVLLAGLVVRKYISSYIEGMEVNNTNETNNAGNDDKMDVEESINFGSDLTAVYGVNGIQGRRPYMEDRNLIIPDLRVVDTSKDEHDDLWNCQCMYLNWQSSTQCFICKTPRKSTGSSTESPSPFIQSSPSSSLLPYSPNIQFTITPKPEGSQEPKDGSEKTTQSETMDTDVKKQEEEDTTKSSTNTAGSSDNSKSTVLNNTNGNNQLNQKFNNLPKIAYFAVFDGHGGQLASTFVSGCLHKYIVRSQYFPRDPKKALHDGFLHADSLYAKKYPVHGLQDGSTGCVLLIIGHQIYAANVGDSRAVLCHNGKAVELSFDHKPDRDTEKKRIEAIGGVVKKGSFFNIPMGPFRIYTSDGVRGGLAVARAFGDTFYKESQYSVDKQLVIAVPEIVERTLDDTDEFIVVASDGFWDVFGNEEAVKFVSELKNSKRMSASEVSSALTTEAFARESLDNITVIVAYLNTTEEQKQDSGKDDKANLNPDDDASTEESNDVIIHASPVQTERKDEQKGD